MNRQHDYGGNFTMNQGNITDIYFHNHEHINHDHEIKLDGIDMNDFK